MKAKMFVYLVLLLGVWGLTAVHADNAVVGDGTAASCTEAAFEIAFNHVQSSGGGMITFNCGTATKTIIFSGQKVVTSPMIIDGADKVILSGGNTARLFAVQTGTLTIRHLTLTNGNGFDIGGGAVWLGSGGLFFAENSIIQNNTTNNGPGSAIYASVFDAQVTLTSSLIQNNSTNNHGAVNSVGLVTITDSTFDNNFAKLGGGALSVAGIATIVDTVFTSNTANGTAVPPNYGGGAILVTPGGLVDISGGRLSSNAITTDEAGGGALDVRGTAILRETLINNNSAAYSGAIYTSSGEVQLYDLEVRNNSAVATGALGNAGSTVKIEGVTFSGNSDQGEETIFNSGWLTMRNSTISLNSSNGLFQTGQAVLENVTFYRNTGVNLYQNSLNAGQTLTLKNVAIDAAGGGDACRVGINSVEPIISLGGNIASDDSCGNYFTQTLDRNETSPDLGVLADNGGPTQTHLPLAGSALIDGGVCLSTITVDQRGVARPAGAACDVGSVEVSELPNNFIWLPFIKK
ncbi:MAG: hypothetical protein IPJ90_14315 [Anaerolineaceae bacterium]|nr:hypothetical protein [Anaerolineaceae bacterium]